VNGKVGGKGRVFILGSRVRGKVEVCCASGPSRIGPLRRNGFSPQAHSKRGVLG